jgi:hypothetical protein
MLALQALFAKLKSKSKIVLIINLIFLFFIKHPLLNFLNNLAADVLTNLKKPNI